MIDGKYMGAITREQFLFFEMKVTAQLYRQGLSDKEILERIKADNIFQNPTDKILIIKNMHYIIINEELSIHCAIDKQIRTSC